ncbi:hypothetical protein LTS18_014622, partial [Coniosporium uncinatum]
MPGRLIMDEHGVNGAAKLSNGIHSDSDGVANNGVRRKDSPHLSAAKNLQAKPTANGERSIPQRDGPPSGDPRAIGSANGTSQSSAPSGLASLQDLPPEIISLTESMQPFGRLVERVSQACFNDALQLIEELANLSVPPNGAPNGVNGVHSTPTDNGNMSANNVAKKKKLMEFAKLHRERFIQLGVLTLWGKDMASVQRLIDVNFWMQERKTRYNWAIDALGISKKALEPFKVPNPDVTTALEVLSTGKAPWMPDLGYIPAEPLTPQQMLKTLRNMNIQLSLRLNLHEKIPRYLRGWTVRSGRATFYSPLEFELDVAISSEEPSSQFWFIDIRFLFEPAPALPDGRFRQGLENQANVKLYESGLVGCYDFFHSLVMTHKIAILRGQAIEMSRGAWIDVMR